TCDPWSRACAKSEIFLLVHTLSLDGCSNRCALFGFETPRLSISASILPQHTRFRAWPFLVLMIWVQSRIRGNSAGRGPLKRCQVKAVIGGTATMWPLEKQARARGDRVRRCEFITLVGGGNSGLAAGQAAVSLALFISFCLGI